MFTFLLLFYELSNDCFSRFVKRKEEKILAMFVFMVASRAATSNGGKKEVKKENAAHNVGRTVDRKCAAPARSRGALFFLEFSKRRMWLDADELPCFLALFALLNGLLKCCIGVVIVRQTHRASFTSGHQSKGTKIAFQEQ